MAALILLLTASAQTAGEPPLPLPGYLRRKGRGRAHGSPADTSHARASDIQSPQSPRGRRSPHRAFAGDISAPTSLGRVWAASPARIPPQRFSAAHAPRRKVRSALASQHLGFETSARCRRQTAVAFEQWLVAHSAAESFVICFGARNELYGREGFNTHRVDSIWASMSRCNCMRQPISRVHLLRIRLDGARSCPWLSLF